MPLFGVQNSFYFGTFSLRLYSTFLNCLRNIKFVRSNLVLFCFVLYLCEGSRSEYGLLFCEESNMHTSSLAVGE